MNASDWCILTAVTVRQNYGYDGWLGIARSAVPNTLTQISPTVLLSLSQSPSLSPSLSHSISLSRSMLGCGRSDRCTGKETHTFCCVLL